MVLSVGAGGGGWTPAKIPWAMCVMLLSLGLTTSICVVAAVSEEISIKPCVKPADIERTQRICTGLDSGCHREHFIFLRCFLGKGRHRHSQHGNGADCHSCYLLIFR